MSKKITIGRSEIIDLPVLGLFDIEAKVDTGAYTSSLHCDKVEVIEESGHLVIHFSVPHYAPHSSDVILTPYQTADFELKNIRSSNGQEEMRYVIKTTIVIMGQKIETDFSLTDRSSMRYPVLMGRKLLSKRFIVDVSKLNVGVKNRKR